MKSFKTRLLLSGCVFGLLLTATAQPASPPANGSTTDTNVVAAPDPNAQEGDSVATEATTNAPGMDQTGSAMPAETPTETRSGTNEPAVNPAYVPPPGPQRTGEETMTLAPVPAQAATGGENELRLNFRNAPLEMVLNYLSDAAGFIIELDTPVHGKVDVWSNQPVTREEAVNLLNSVLNKNGYAAIRNGRTLRIMEKHAAVTSNIPVKTGNNPDAVPNNDEIVTQIIPIRYVQAAQLVTDLSPLIAPQAIVANEAGNSIILTDTQANIKHAVEIIKAIDSSAEDVTEVRVFHLKFADPNDMATLLTSLFPDQSGGGNQTPIRFGGGFGRVAAAPAVPGGNTPADRIKKREQVMAVPDLRTSSVVVTASKDLMEQIGSMVERLDVDSAKVQHVRVFHLDNADAQEILPVLQSMFQKNTTSRNNNNSSTQNSALMSRTQQNQNNSSSITSGSGLGGGGSGSRPNGGTSF